MICRVPSDNPCANCKYAEEWDYEDDSIIYRCRIDMTEECDGQPDELSDYEKYARENPRE